MSEEPIRIRPPALPAPKRSRKPRVPDEIKAAKPPVERDAAGYFAKGNNGGPGRPLGARNRFAEDFIEDFHVAWREGGAEALRRCAKNDPSTFVRAAAQLIPRDFLIEGRNAGLIVVRLSDEDMQL